jgi:hypothetical protein
VLGCVAHAPATHVAVPPNKVALEDVGVRLSVELIGLERPFCFGGDHGLHYCW